VKPSYHVRAFVEGALLLFFASLNFLAAQTEYSSDSIATSPLDHLDNQLQSHLSFAFENSWQINLQNILVERGEATSTRMSSGKGTKVRANFTTGYEQEVSGGLESTGFKFRYNVSAVKPIYHWGALEADHNSGLIILESAKNERVFSFLSLYRVLVNWFVDIVVNKQVANHQILSLAIQEEDLSLYKSQVDRGEVSTDMLANAQLRYDRADLTLQSLENKILKEENSFREAAGLDASAPIVAEAVLPPVSLDHSLLERQVMAFIGEIETVSLQYKSRQITLDQAALNLEKYTVNNRPKINGLIQFRQDSETLATGNRTDLELKEAFAGVQFNWSIYDGGSTRGLLREAMATKRQRERELSNYRDSVTSDLNFLLTDLRIYAQQTLLDEEQLRRDLASYEQTLVDVREGRVPEKTGKQFERNVEVQRAKLYLTRGRYFKALTSIYVTMEAPFILNYID
tara:strand:- start:1114 stop:2487 length:1374 start_codon:yes stop_codon:yes gene_type:complete